MPAHTGVCKRDTAAGSTSKNNPILSILTEVFLLMLLYLPRKTNKQNEKNNNNKPYGLLGSRECVVVGGRILMDSTCAPSHEDQRDRQPQPEQQY